MFKRLLTAFLVVLMLVPLAACGDSTKPPVAETTNPSATTAAPETTEPAGPTPDLPEVRYEGTELVFVNRPADMQHYAERWLYAILLLSERLVTTAAMVPMFFTPVTVLTSRSHDSTTVSHRMSRTTGGASTLRAGMNTSWSRPT